MGGHRSQFCIYSSLDVAAYTKTGVRPPCAFHEHISRHDATELTGSILFSKTLLDGTQKHFFEFDYVRRVSGDSNQHRLQAIVNRDAREWSIRRSGGSRGCEVHQLVAVGK